MNWLERKRRSAPETMDAAERLHQRLRTLASQWAEYDQIAGTASEEAFVREAEAVLASESMDAALAAWALDWLASGYERWSSHRIWAEAWRRSHRSRPAATSKSSDG